jgi:hypothetical protein
VLASCPTANKVYTVYRVTNLVNGKGYIGVHKTSSPDDSYLGSGRLIRAAVKKHGKHSFRKEVLRVFLSPIDAYDKEAEIIGDRFGLSGCDYNMNGGGLGGFRGINPNQSLKGRQRLRERMLQRWADQGYRQRMTGEGNPNFGGGLCGEDNPNFKKGLPGAKNPMFGKKRPDLAEWNRQHLSGKQRGPLPEETRRRISEAKKLWWSRRKALVR